MSEPVGERGPVARHACIRELDMLASFSQRLPPCLHAAGGAFCRPFRPRCVNEYVHPPILGGDFTHGQDWRDEVDGEHFVCLRDEERQACWQQLV